MTLSTCPCGNHKSFIDCCEPYINGKQTAPNAKSLMRSRYTAYVLGDMNYLEKTCSGQAKINFDLRDTQTWNQSIKWLGLTVISHQSSGARAKVEFIARYQQQSIINAIHEISDFELINGHWFYIGGIWKPAHKQKLSLNAICWCGSLKKFKNCHAKKV